MAGFFLFQIAYRAWDMLKAAGRKVRGVLSRKPAEPPEG